MNRRKLLLTAAGIAAMSLFSPASSMAQSVDIGYSVTDTTNPFLGWLTNEVKALAEKDGITLEIADAGLSPVKQMEQIENFIAMGVKVIDIMPVDPNNVQDIIKRAQAQGIKILVAGTDTGVYDVMMNIDQYGAGRDAVNLATEWMVQKFSSDGTAKGMPQGDESLKVIVIPQTDTIDAKNRTNGMIETIQAWGHANVVVSPTEAKSTAQGTSVMETLFLQNPDVDVVLTYNADAALGVNEYLMSQFGLDHSKIGVFTGDWSPPVQETIDMSADNESVFRGTIQIAGPVLNGEPVDLPVATYKVMKALMEGEKPWGDWIKDAVGRALPKKGW
ncbi:sugar ABC transporter substrate-binding protein [uncultured Cohaesibacter sp.]|uniref:sugar ABC transporter substrate-binding protein n=1 Tax=uncultured Cohaesibacter sp. TaxID=1002546 RepID=UPI0029C69400|nr:sugar ABC transporter substrate-binding protein [uncultured Cohaesibacter sp.]